MLDQVNAYSQAVEAEQEADENDVQLACPECGSSEWNGTEACCLACSVQAYNDIWR